MVRRPRLALPGQAASPGVATLPSQLPLGRVFLQEAECRTMVLHKLAEVATGMTFGLLGSLLQVCLTRFFCLCWVLLYVNSKTGKFRRRWYQSHQPR